MNQWSSTLVENAARLHAILANMIESRQSGAETIRLLRSPQLRAYLVEQTRRADEEQQQQQRRVGTTESKANKKDTLATTKKESRTKSPGREKSPKARKQAETIDENAEFVSFPVPDTQADRIDQVDDSGAPVYNKPRITIHDSNMIYFGLPDIYIS